jgi:acyl-CoA dehydrogenase
MTAEIPVPPWQTEDARAFRESVRRFIEAEWLPRQPRWRAQRGPDAEAWRDAGRIGLLLPDVPAEYGGGGGTFAHECVVIEELARAGISFGAGVQGVVAHYLLAYGSEDQKRRWLPRMARGELVAAIAMTEPGAGSDLAAITTSAVRQGDHYVINGSKTFITNAAHAGLVCIAAKTNPTAPAMRAISMIIAETKDLPGYSVGRPLEKVGMHGQDTCEIFFDGVQVPDANLLGPVEGRGFTQMMQQLPFERLSIAVSALALAEQAVAITVRHARDRIVAGKPLFDHQNTRFTLAECVADVRVGRAFVDDCVSRFIGGRLDEAGTAVAKYWMTERLCRIVDQCVQLHGGYGYMAEYPIARMWLDARVQRIYGGTNEVMKEVIAWSL